MTERLFVYGTLGPGRPNEHVLADIGGTWQSASVTGRLRQAGWGAEMGFPGLDLDDQGDEIEGFLFVSENLSTQWEILDAFEGEGYQRVSTRVMLEDKSTVNAFIYTLKDNR